MHEMPILHIYGSKHLTNGLPQSIPNLITMLKVAPNDDYSSLKQKELDLFNHQTREQLLLTLKYFDKEPVGVNFDRPHQLPAYERSYDSNSFLSEVRRTPLGDSELEAEIIAALKSK